MPGGEVVGGAEDDKWSGPLLSPHPPLFFFDQCTQEREAPLSCEVPRPKHSVCFCQCERVGEVCVGSVVPCSACPA